MHTPGICLGLSLAVATLPAITVSTSPKARSPQPAQLVLADDWQRVSPEAAGFAPDIGTLLDDGVKSGKLANLHAVVVVRHGKLVLERYYAGPDERRGEPLGMVTFAPEVKHDLRSISKSIVGLLYGIALREGKVPALDQPLVDQFPAYADLARDPQRRRLTVAHALSMTLGTEWDDSRCPTPTRATARSPWRWLMTCTASSSIGRSSPSRAEAGPIMAAPPRCSAI
jgi:CubicO group peptidase (beta-lactamase class C family)